MVKSRKQQSLLTTQLGLKEAKEAQENEIEALKAIFMEDYESVVVTTAWKVVPTGHEFRLHLKPQEQELKKHVSLDLHVKFPKTYPRSAPDIKIENARGLSETHLNKAQGHISNLIKENIGQEMVYTIAQFIQEFITMNNNGVKMVTKQTSFHEQMLNRIEQMTKVEQKKAIEEEFRARQLEEQERIILAQKINEETQNKMAKFEEERLKRKQMKVKEDQNSKKLVDSSLTFPTVNFDAFVMLNPDASQDVPFKSVVLGPSIGKGTIGSTYLVQATNFQGKNVEPSERHVLVLKEISIVSPYYFNIEGKRKIEKDLFRVKRLRHTNLITIYESELGRSEAGWNLYILMEYARGGTLEDLLKKCGTIQLPFAREYMKQLLNALDYVHANSFVHKASNILLTEVDGKGECIAKLSDVNFHRKLLGEVPPEQETKPYSRKNDIWCLGVIFIQMLFGLNVIKQYNSLEDLLKSELLNQPFFNDGSVNLLDTPLKFITSSGKTNNVRSNHQHPLNKDNNELAGSFVESNTQFAFSPPCSSQSTTFSRYRLDFEEIHFLGKVRLNPNDIEKTRKILREITTLSRLHHQYVVRYYTTWFEDSDGAWKETESFSENIGGSLATSNDDLTKVMMMTSNKNRIGNSKKFSPKEEKTRILYIQMEYCEKQTLKDIIDIGVKPDDGWSNIFLDANGDVKIGDFGLATTSDEVGSFRVSNFDRMSSREDSMTGDVGTTLYVAPEVLSNNKIFGLRYNHKGIIFFEICYKFSTEMERRVTILGLRKPEIIFPKDFSTNKMENQVYIIRWCLHHNPKNRPTSLELLKSEWMPAKLEDEHVQEYVRTMANPNTPHYRTLISTLFTQSPDKHKDHTYDFNSVMRDHMLRIFRHHGGVEISTPLMMPKSDIYEEDKKAVHLMDIEGGIVQLNYDLTVPFARYVSRQPRFVYEADFDIIHSRHSPMVAEAEIFKIVDEIIEEFPPLKSINYCFFLNHTNIIETIFDCCRIPEEIRRGVYSLLGQLEKKYSINQIRAQLSNKYKLPRNKLISSTSMRTRIHDAIKDFKLLMKYAKCLGVQLFQVMDDNNRKDVLAAGGRYDSLIQQFRHPMTVTSKNDDEKSFGYWASKKCDVYVASFGKVHLEERLDLIHELWAHNIKADFMYEESSDLTPEMLANACKKQGINWIVIMRHRNQDLYKNSSSSSSSRIDSTMTTTVKVKNLLWKTEDEVPRNELCVRLNSEIIEQARIDLHSSGSKYHNKHSLSPQSEQWVIEQINKGGVPVLALDINREILRKFVDCNVLEDESFKSKAHQKEYLINVQETLKQRHQEGYKQVWLYSHRDDFGILYHYFL
ncbi:2949_t:CDS:10 [Diversispora eburnea]|uniref:non-specific serine/threonine protein kinase n=1 Tax=Diversispora eburnea TaxID=1213867 RepID=A0A9N8V282_9GLOM|nr:2949_t:CDS:10 [Diversispora eburnea]